VRVVQLAHDVVLELVQADVRPKYHDRYGYASAWSPTARRVVMGIYPEYRIEQ